MIYENIKDYFPYVILEIYVCPKVYEQTMIFFCIQAFLLPEDEIADEFICFCVWYPV